MATRNGKTTAATTGLGATTRGTTTNAVNEFEVLETKLLSNTAALGDITIKTNGYRSNAQNRTLHTKIVKAVREVLTAATR